MKRKLAVLLWFLTRTHCLCEEGSGYLLLVFSDVHDCNSRREKSLKSLGSSAASAPLDPHKISVCLVSKIRWRACIRWWSRWVVFLQLLVALADRTTSILLVILGHQRSNNLQNHRILTTQILHEVEAPEMAGASSCSLAKSLCIFRDFSEDGWNQSWFATTSAIVWRLCILRTVHRFCLIVLQLLNLQTLFEYKFFCCTSKDFL